MAEADPYEYRILRVPRDLDIDGAIVELHDDGPTGNVTMDIRIPARQADEDWTRDAMIITRRS